VDGADEIVARLAAEVVEDEQVAALQAEAERYRTGLPRR
jgi:hypothetical protein